MGLTRGHELLPLAHGLFDRCQCAAHHDGSRNHDPRRDFLQDGQIGTGAQNGNLQCHAHKFGRGHDRPCPPAGFCLLVEHIVMLAQPPFGQLLFHTQSTDDFGVLHGGIHKVCRALAGIARLLQQTACGKFVRQRQRKDDQRAHGRHDAQPRMEGKTQGQKQGHPRRVEKRKDTLTGHELAHAVDVLQGGMGTAIRARQPVPDHPVKGGMRKHVVELQSCTHQQLRADEFQQTVGDQKRNRDGRDHDQCQLVPAGQNPVIDLQHIERADEHKDIAEKAE
ncbi:hypothetical protein Z946_216 [Sulfitobacter noctilucicola]|nr:hypothetical protein Z946_216 [Sulfitobacter noctilucicola]